MNSGEEPLESAFSHWDWSRAVTPRGTAILYDVRRRSGDDLAIAMTVDAAGRVERLACPPATTLPKTLWRMPRTPRADAGHQPSVRLTLEDAPFYARSLLASHLCGSPVVAIHESLSLDRFSAAWVKALLPFRMPRFDR